MRKLISMILGLALSLTATFAFASCGGNGGGGNKVSDTDETLQIYVWQGGYGTDWADSLIDSFQKQEWVKEKYPKPRLKKVKANLCLIGLPSIFI